MRASIVGTLLRREWIEMIRNRLLVSPRSCPAADPDRRADPARPRSSASERCRPSSPPRSCASGRSGSDSRAGELAGAFAVQQFLVFFLLMPAYIPLSIATFSIIGEKQARSLEPVLAAPIRTIELLAGKAIAALVPGVLAGWVTYLRLRRRSPRSSTDRDCSASSRDPSWLAGVFVLGPAVGLSSVVAGVIVSARVNDPRVAQQIGGVIIVPIIGLVLVQATGTVLVGPSGYLLMAAVDAGRVAHRPAHRGAAVRPRGDPHPLALSEPKLGLSR